MYGTDCRHKPFAIPTNTHSILYCNATENIIHSFIHSLILSSSIHSCFLYRFIYYHLVTRWTLYGCVGVGPVCEREPQWLAERYNGCVGVGPVCEREPQWLAERYTGVSAWDLFVRESHSDSLNAIRVCRRGTCLWERATVTRWTL